MLGTCGKQVRGWLNWITVLAVLFLIGSWWYFDQGPARRTPPGPLAAPASANGPAVAPLAQALVRQTAPVSPAARVVAAVQPSVVNISALRPDIAEPPAGQKQPDGSANPGGSVFRFIDPLAGASMKSIGSGVIMTEDGAILTNYHVVQQSDQIYVTCFGEQGSSRYPAEVVHLDEQVDLALLKIRPVAPLPTATLGDSELLSIGDQVLAMGSPFGLAQSVSQGIISGKRDAIVIEGITHRDLLQTDAAINQGNSGGPLVNMQGQVVGINTAIYTPNGAFAGVGFAVPAATVREFLHDLIALPEPAAWPGSGGSPRPGFAKIAAAGAPPPIAPGAVPVHSDRGPCQLCHQVVGGPTAAALPPQPMSTAMAAPAGEAGMLGYPVLYGAAVRPVDSIIANHFGQPENSGVFVCNVLPGSPAAQAGLQAGDIIVKHNGRRCQTPTSLFASMASPDGGRTRLGIIRSGRRQEVVLQQAAPRQEAMLPAAQVQPPATTDQTLAALPSAAPAADSAIPAPVPSPQEWEWMGMELVPAEAALATGQGATATECIVVKEISARSKAELAGVQVNDVLVSINRLPVRSTADLSTILSALSPLDGVLLELERASQRVYATL
ncbi:MAG: trypsin-like peptidase domain-containing protein [Thermodesulfobacteriota bacterium]